MDKIIIDTNVLYDWIGRENLGMPRSARGWDYDRMRRILNADARNISINAVSVFEALTLHRNNRVNIQKICKFIIDKRITIIDEYDFSITNSNLQYLLFLTQSNDERKYINTLVEIKARVEIKYVAVLVVMFAQMYSKLYLHELKNKGIQNLEFVESEWMDLYFLNYKSPTKIVRKAISSKIHQGYKSNLDMSKEVKNIFHSQVYQQTNIAISLIDMLIKEPNRISNLSEWFNNNQLDNPYLEKLNSEPNFINRSLWKTIDESIIKRIINDKKYVFRHFSECQLEYIIKVIFYNFFIGPQPKKFKKNDILDLKILYGLEENDTYILTGDEEMINFIHNKLPEKLKYLNRIIS